MKDKTMDKHNERKRQAIMLFGKERYEQLTREIMPRVRDIPPPFTIPKPFSKYKTVLRQLVLEEKAQEGEADAN